MKKNKFLSGRLDLVLHSHRLTKVGMGNHIIQNLSNTLSKNISLLIKKSVRLDMVNILDLEVACFSVIAGTRQTEVD